MDVTAQAPKNSRFFPKTRGEHTGSPLGLSEARIKCWSLQSLRIGSSGPCRGSRCGKRLSAIGGCGTSPRIFAAASSSTDRAPLGSYRRERHYRPSRRGCDAGDLETGPADCGLCSASDAPSVLAPHSTAPEPWGFARSPHKYDAQVAFKKAPLI